MGQSKSNSKSIARDPGPKQESGSVWERVGLAFTTGPWRGLQDPQASFTAEHKCDLLQLVFLTAPPQQGHHRWESRPLAKSWQCLLMWKGLPTSSGGMCMCIDPAQLVPACEQWASYP